MLYYQARYHYEYLEFNSTSKLRISIEHAPQIPQARGKGAGLFMCTPHLITFRTRASQVSRFPAQPFIGGQKGFWLAEKGASSKIQMQVEVGLYLLK